jgi:hypothetical protein
VTRPTAFMRDAISQTRCAMEESASRAAMLQRHSRRIVASMIVSRQKTVGRSVRQRVSDQIGEHLRCR